MSDTHTSSLVRDIITPANAVTVVGLLLSLAGAFRLDTGAGLALMVTGRLLDIFDGPIARRTHTSHIGAILDATADKLAVLAMLIAGYHFKVIPVIIIVLVFTYNLIITVTNILIEYTKTPTRSTISGKRAMFLHTSSLALYVWASLAAGSIHSLFFALATSVFLAGGWFAIISIRDYSRQLRTTRPRGRTSA